jgi:hypothetical protein
LLSFFRPVFSVTLLAQKGGATVKLQIYLTEAMTNAILLSAQQERRYPRQQAEWLLEHALGVSTPQAQTAQAVVYEGQTVEVEHVVQE